MIERNHKALGADLPASLPEVMARIVAERLKDEDDPFRILAELPASIYITASPETSLYRAIQASGKQPQILFSPWRRTSSNTPAEPKLELIPGKETPLVYHVFGALGSEDSLVLTEDDFFDYLIATATYKLIPKVVLGSLTESSLIFLGFRLDDWTFRVLFRLIMTLEGSGALRNLSHVGVQVNPEAHSMADVKRARTYLESYFSRNRDTPRIDVFWGSAQDFLVQLRDQLATDDRPHTTPSGQGATRGWF